MDEEKDKSAEQQKQPGPAESAPVDKPKKQPKVWVKPGTGAPAVAGQAAVGGAGGGAPAVQRETVEPAPRAAVAAAPPRKPVKTETPTYVDISQDPLVSRIQAEAPGSVLAAQAFLGQKILTIDASTILPVCELLKRDAECHYDLLEDLTAVDCPEKEKRFAVVYQLCSIPRNVQLRLKCDIAEMEEIASVTTVWSTANWLEREVYDLFGIVFSGHPDLRRILLPEDWIGHPLRKDYDLRKQDEDWIRRHLQIRK